MAVYSAVVVMAFSILPRGGARMKCLTMDTAKALYHTLNGLVDLCKELLADGYDFVMLGEFSNDPIEKEIGKFRQGSGGTYFISVQQVIEKLNINKTKLLLRLDAESVANLNVLAGHQCSKCGYLLDEKSSEVFDALETLDEKLCTETKMSLVHIAGYVTRNDEALDEDHLLDVTTFYYQKYGDFTKELDRGGLNIPSDSSCQWSIFCYLMFNQVKHSVCQKSLSNLFMVVSDMHTFNMKRNHARILSNIFFKNHCVQNTPCSTKEAKQKVLKLSVEC